MLLKGFATPYLSNSLSIMYLYSYNEGNKNDVLDFFTGKKQLLFHRSRLCSIDNFVFDKVYMYPHPIPTFFTHTFPHHKEAYYFLY